VHLGRIYRTFIDFDNINHLVAYVEKDDTKNCRVGGWRGTFPSFSNRPPPNRT
jgi:hypothetical protein